MAPLTPFSLSLLTLLGLLTSGALSTTFTMVNNCGYAVWPGIRSNPDGLQLATTGFALQKGQSETLTAPASWVGRFWGRTLCTQNSTGKFSCVTGDCGSGEVACSGSGAAPPATLAEFTLGGTGGLDFFDVNLVDGYNLPMLVVPQGGTGTNCNNTGCVVDLNGVCPSELKVTNAAGSEVVGCKSACYAFNQPQYCCVGAYATPETCKPSSYSQIFKNACPLAYSYAYDDKTSTFTCANADYTITFCPSPNTRLPSLQPEDDPQYTQCKQPFNCGNLTDISYPFWGGSNRPKECGRLGFELTNCEDETQLPHIVIEKLDFHVSNINSQDLLHTMTIARSDLWDSPCTDLLVNTTLDYNRFSYVPTVRNLTLYYGCLPQNESVLNNFTCTAKDTNISYYVDDSLARVDVPGRPTCSTKIKVPIFWEGFDVMPDNAMEEVEKVLKQGFQVEYSADWDLCRLCMNSNGTCGSNATTDSFLCLCGDRPSNSTTCPITPIVHGTHLCLFLIFLKYAQLRSSDFKSSSNFLSLTPHQNQSESPQFHVYEPCREDKLTSFNSMSCLANKFRHL